MGKEVRDHAILARIDGVARGFPLLPGAAQERDEALVVNVEERVVPMLRGRHEPRTRTDERVADDRCAGRHLVAGIRQPDPDLAARLVQKAAVAPRDGNRQALSRGRHGCEPNRTRCRLAR